jgi:hypothetical protein
MSFPRTRIGLTRLPGLLLLLAVAGCEPDRLGYVDLAADRVCNEARRCDNLGPEGLHATHDECIIEERSRFNGMWPESECGEGRINRDRFESCMDRARLVACDGGFGDWLAAYDHCRAERVCID